MERQRREYVGDLYEDGPEVTMTLVELVEDGEVVQRLSEEFELNGEYTTYRELRGRYGRRIVEAFIEEALDNAR